MNIEIPSAPKDMDSEQLAKCLEAGADYNLYTASPMRAYMHGIDMEHWLRASADRIRTLTAEVERLRAALEHIREYWNRDANDRAMHDALWHIVETCEETLNGGSDE